MRKANIKAILLTVVILSVLLCMAGCKKQPATTTTAPSVESTKPTGTTKPTEIPIPTESTSPSIPVTTPVDVTLPTEEGIPSDCVHELGNWIVERASTCTTEGLRYRECGLCHFKIELEAIASISHSAGAWVVDQKATCTSEGTQHQECAQCKTSLVSIVVAKTDHKTYAIRGYAPTASTPGLTQGYLCGICGTTVQEQYTISPLSSIDFTYMVNADRQTCTVTGLKNRKATSLILPDSIDNYTITAISDGAFTGCTALQTVYLPDTVTTIGRQAFSGCTALTNITYEGTIEQWIFVAKGSNWNIRTGEYNIYCKNNHLSK